jgi:hypothetical protein
MDLPTLLTRAQALAAGIAARTVDDLVRRRRWLPLLPRVYRTTPGPVEPVDRIGAAALWAGPDAVLTGLGAAWWLGLPVELPAVLTFVAPQRRGRYGRTVAVLPGWIDPVDVRRVGGLSVTAQPRSALDAAVELGASGTGLLAISGVAFAELDAALGRRTGAPGAAGAAAVLRDLRHSSSIDSVCRGSGVDLGPGLSPPASTSRPHVSWGRSRPGPAGSRTRALTGPGYREL